MPNELSFRNDNLTFTHHLIGAALGVDHKTVANVREDAEQRGEIRHVATVTDTKGRKQPARKMSREEL
jgi:hypothetical protein